MSHDALVDLRKVEMAIFKDTQAKLPEKDRAAAYGKDMCMADNDDRICTKAEGHEGDHIAHGVLGYILHRWAKEGK